MLSLKHLTVLIIAGVLFGNCSDNSTDSGNNIPEIWLPDSAVVTTSGGKFTIEHDYQENRLLQTTYLRPDGLIKKKITFNYSDEKITNVYFEYFDIPGQKTGEMSWDLFWENERLLKVINSADNFILDESPAVSDTTIISNHTECGYQDAVFTRGKTRNDYDTLFVEEYDFSNDCQRIVFHAPNMRYVIGFRDQNSAFSELNFPRDFSQFWTFRTLNTERRFSDRFNPYVNTYQKAIRTIMMDWTDQDYTYQVNDQGLPTFISPYQFWFYEQDSPPSSLEIYYRHE